MKRKLFAPKRVESPCISICAMDEETGYCRGCFRTQQEITGWENYTDEQRRKVLDKLPPRQSAHP